MAKLEVTRVIRGPDIRVGCVALSPHGDLVAGSWVRGATRQLAVHATSTGHRLHEAEPIELDDSLLLGTPTVAGRGRILDFHPSEPRLLVATGAMQDELSVLDTRTWSSVGHADVGGLVRSALYSPDGTAIGLAQRFSVTIRDSQTLDLKDAMRVDAPSPTAAWLHDGSELVSAGRALRRLSPADRRSHAPPQHRKEPKLDEWVHDRILLTVPHSTEMVTARHSTGGLERWDLGGDVGAEVVRIPFANPRAMVLWARPCTCSSAGRAALMISVGRRRGPTE